MSTSKTEPGGTKPFRSASSQAEVRSRCGQALGSRDQNKQIEREYKLQTGKLTT